LVEHIAGVGDMLVVVDNLVEEDMLLVVDN
jgi:hypothetical protein